MHAKIPIYMFLAVVTLFASLCYAVMIYAGENTQLFGVGVLLLQFAPMQAAFVTRFLVQKNLHGFGWGWGKWRYQFAAWALPFVIALVSFSLVWVFGFGDLVIAPVVIEAKSGITEIFGTAPASAILTLLAIIAVNATLGLLVVFPAIGEELGWRGFLVPELFKHYSFAKTSVISGVIWSIYHYPLLIFFAAPKLGISALPLLISATLGGIALSFIMAWLRLRSGSVWTAVIFHAALNIHIQGFFQNLTVKNSPLTHYISGEYGLMIALVAGAFGLVAWRQFNSISK